MKKILLAAAVLALGTSSAFAHRVNLFAWVEGDAVACEAKFAGGSAVRAGKIRVADAADTGKTLLTGVTDDSGHFRFALTDALRRAPAGLLLSVNAGEGHLGTWTVAAQDLPGRAAGPAPARPAVQPASPSQPTVTLTRAQLDALTEECVRKALAPLEQELSGIRRELALMRTRGPSLQDILGGIGWLVGLAGVAAWFRRPRQDRRPHQNGDRQ